MKQGLKVSTSKSTVQRRPIELMAAQSHDQTLRRGVDQNQPLRCADTARRKASEFLPPGLRYARDNTKPLRRTGVSDALTTTAEGQGPNISTAVLKARLG